MEGTFHSKHSAFTVVQRNPQIANFTIGPLPTPILASAINFSPSQATVHLHQHPQPTIVNNFLFLNQGLNMNLLVINSDPGVSVESEFKKKRMEAIEYCSQQTIYRDERYKHTCFSYLFNPESKCLPQKVPPLPRDIMRYFSKWYRGTGQGNWLDSTLKWRGMSKTEKEMWIHVRAKIREERKQQEEMGLIQQDPKYKTRR